MKQFPSKKNIISTFLLSRSLWMSLKVVQMYILSLLTCLLIHVVLVHKYSTLDTFHFQLKINKSYINLFDGYITLGGSTNITKVKRSFDVFSQIFYKNVLVDIFKKNCKMTHINRYVEHLAIFSWMEVTANVLKFFPRYSVLSGLRGDQVVRIYAGNRVFFIIRV